MMTEQWHCESDGCRSEQKVDELNVREVMLVVDAREPQDSDQATHREKHGVGDRMAPAAPADFDGTSINGTRQTQVDKRVAVSS